MLSALKKKRVRVGLGLLLALALAGGAYAYFTTTGAGTGNAQVGTNTAPITINATITPGAGGIVPGNPNPASVAFTVNNPGGGNQYVTSVSLPANGVQAYSDAAHTNNITGTGAGQCDTTAFSMATVSELKDVPTGGPTALPNNGSLVFADNGKNQNACENAYLVASFTSN